MRDLPDTRRLLGELQVQDGANQTTGLRVNRPLNLAADAHLVAMAFAPYQSDLVLSLVTLVASPPSVVLCRIPELDRAYVDEWEVDRILYGELADAAMYFDFPDHLVAIAADKTHVYVLDNEAESVDSSAVRRAHAWFLRLNKPQFDSSFEQLAGARGLT